MAALTEERERRARFAALSTREAKVVDLLVAGAGTRRIAATLGMPLQSALAVRRPVMRKAGVGSLAELVRVAIGVTPSAVGARAADVR